MNNDIRRLGPVKERLSQAVIHNGLLTTSGQVADAPKGLSVAAETSQILDKIDTILLQAGATRSCLLSATVYLSDMTHFDAMNQAWAAWVDPDALPTRSTTVTPMTSPDKRVAIAITAVLPYQAK